jgi:GPI mannosyltransferase 3
MTAIPPAVPAPRRWRSILALLALAAILRAAVVPLPIAHHRDEIWQYIEPAYRLVTGLAVIPWEYREGIRGWLIPALLSLPTALGQIIAPETSLHLILIRLTMLLLSLPIVIAALALGRHFYGRSGWIVGFVAAVWAELVYFAPRALSDSISLSLLFPALALLVAGVAEQERRRFALAGLLLGFAVCTRFQIAPVVAILALWSCRIDRIRWLCLLAGGSLAIALSGLADVLGGQLPFRWMIDNLRINLVENRSADYGVEPASFYPLYLLRMWGWSAVAIVPLALIGSRKLPVLLLAALVNITLHSLIPHKEYRFILFSSCALIMLAALGSAEILQRLSAHGPRKTAAIACALLWLGISVTVGATRPFSKGWGNDRQLVTLMQAAGRVPGLCGLALYGYPPRPLTAYSFVNRPVPIYLFSATDSPLRARAMNGAFNVVMAPADSLRALGSVYRLERCVARKRPVAGEVERYCLFVRPGPCVPADNRADDINAVLARAGT